MAIAIDMQAFQFFRSAAQLQTVNEHSMMLCRQCDSIFALQHAVDEAVMLFQIGNLTRKLCISAPIPYGLIRYTKTVSHLKAPHYRNMVILYSFNNFIRGSIILVIKSNFNIYLRVFQKIIPCDHINIAIFYIAI